MDVEKQGSETSGSEEAPAPKKQEPNQSEQLATKGASTAPAHKGGGLRTKQGKEKSSQNSLKHRILSQVALHKGESRAKFNSLQNGLRNDLEPEGTLEELLVDKLAVIIWRLRRLIIADGEQAQKGPESFGWGDTGLGTNPLDLLLRYETNLERNFDRTLIQLERLQRIRRGQPVAPTLNVNVST